MVLDDLAVGEADTAPRGGGDAVVVRDENDGAALLVELLEEFQHLKARFGVQRAGRLIRHDDGRVRRDI